MTDDLVKRADEALKDVTPGPWCVGPADDTTVSSFGYGDVSQTLGNYGSLSDLPRMEANARFIAAARELVPLMRDRIEADAKRIAELKGRLFNCSTDLNTYMTAHEAAEARVKVLEDALHRVEGMTPSLANAATAHDLHLTVRSIARAALEGEK